MNILISLGPIIGVGIISLYGIGCRINLQVKGEKQLSKTMKRIYVGLLAMECVLIMTSIVVPKITGKNYLLADMTNLGFRHMTPYTFKVSYFQSNRAYNNRIFMTEEELENVRAICTAEEGRVFLVMVQQELRKEIEITNQDVLLDMSEYIEGDISFILKNEEGKNIKFELVW